MGLEIRKRNFLFSYLQNLNICCDRERRKIFCKMRHCSVFLSPNSRSRRGSDKFGTSASLSLTATSYISTYFWCFCVMMNKISKNLFYPFGASVMIVDYRVYKRTPIGTKYVDNNQKMFIRAPRATA